LRKCAVILTCCGTVHDGPPRTLDVELCDDIHIEIAQIIAPEILLSPSSFHDHDPDFTPDAFTHRYCRPNETLTTLTRLCKRLYYIYAPYSTWRSLYIEVKTPRSAQLLGKEYEPSPSLTRVLKCPETGIYARELLIRYVSSSWDAGMTRDFVHEFTDGNMLDFNRFLANTPRLETVRCINSASNRPPLPITFVRLLSSLASLRYLFWNNFTVDHMDSPWSLLLPQVRILKYHLLQGGYRTTWGGPVIYPVRPPRLLSDSHPQPGGTEHQSLCAYGRENGISNEKPAFPNSALTEEVVQG
jgi:hypothetical protein